MQIIKIGFLILIAHTMCPKELFHNYIEVKGDQIFVGNNMVRTIIRIHNVAL